MASLAELRQPAAKGNPQYGLAAFYGLRSVGAVVIAHCRRLFQQIAGIFAECNRGSRL
ncbi:hypothetical protein NTGZN8_150054 [Candidatus Nitrotoga fabula]|uniref:Uncharacterized protein n=1 Tax=Candidatus Nitrotoga fabula TaxID=2182327 RepID=A0A916BFB4_9PROT|nr:hypothetical protein NTGZN8_150054 [Candidatus Nitrotoga fabula]